MKILIFILFLLISGCGHFETITYYTPTSRPGLGVSGSTRITREVAVIKLNDDIDILLSIFDDNQSNTIRMMFDLPSNTTLKFVEKEFVIYSEKKKILAPIDRIRANYISAGIGSFKYFTSEDQLTGDTYIAEHFIGSDTFGHRPFLIDVKINDNLPDSFSMKVPDFLLSGEKISLETIQYKKNTGTFYLMPTP